MSAVALVVLLVAALAFGAFIGARAARASQRIDALIAGYHRDIAVNDAADNATGGIQ